MIIRNSEWKSFSKYLIALPDRSIINAEINGQKLRFEVVNTRDSLSQGLSGRKEIGSDGMLFVFAGEKTYRTFWMPNMYFDLDILWLNENKVVGITYKALVEAKGMPLNKYRYYPSNAPTNVVLEVISGKASDLGIKVGDIIMFKQ